jgi:Uma2 family endonuclease
LQLALLDHLQEQQQDLLQALGVPKVLLLSPGALQLQQQQQQQQVVWQAQI